MKTSLQGLRRYVEPIYRARPGKRHCLKCQHGFHSEDVTTNRLCKPCDAENRAMPVLHYESRASGRVVRKGLEGTK